MGKKAKQKAGRKDRRRGPEDPTVPSHLSPQPWMAGATSARADADDLAARERRIRQAPGAAELAARLAGLGTLLQRQVSRADTGDGLTRARLSALALLVLGGPRTLGELAAAERVRPPTMTRLVHAMEADGLVVREPHPSDRRSIVVRASAAGEAQLREGRARQVDGLSEVLASLDAPGRAGLDDAISRVERLLRSTSPDTVATRG
jgi:DNA-binding MarR family transcriptional regulator